MAATPTSSTSSTTATSATTAISSTTATTLIYCLKKSLITDFSGFPALREKLITRLALKPFVKRWD